MHVGLVIAIGLAVAFALTNGFHDASNAIATLVATRAATPGQAVALSAVFNMGGAVLLGTAVADTIGKIVTVPQAQMIPVVGAAWLARQPGTPSPGGGACRRRRGTLWSGVWSARPSPTAFSRAPADSAPYSGAASTAGTPPASSVFWSPC